MYTRRKVFSIANDYDYNDYNDYYERLYSEAFEDGVDYAERMFAEEEKKSFLDTLKGLPAKAKEKIVNQWNKYAKEEGKGVNWKNIGNRTAMVAAPAAVLAGLGYGGYKLATRKKEKEYSEGFEDGFDFAVQKMYTTEAQANSRAKKLEERMSKIEGKIKNGTATDAEKSIFENYQSLKQDPRTQVAQKSVLTDATRIAEDQSLTPQQRKKALAAAGKKQMEQSAFDLSKPIGTDPVTGEPIYEYKAVTKAQKAEMEAEAKRRAAAKAAENTKYATVKKSYYDKMKSNRNLWRGGAIGAGILGVGGTTAALLANRRRNND